MSDWGGPTWRRGVGAAEAALGLLDEVGVPQDRPVDVFGLCEDLGLWLAFAPLDVALGAFVPTGSGGVLITTRRPLTIQRYTAAHELGHWRLGHGVAADGIEQVFGPSPAAQERAAQTFAANLLLPPPLVATILGRVRPPGEPLTGAHCYALAREAGVSYEAAVRQLANLGQLRPAHANLLLSERPLTIKTELGHGRRPVSGWADVWPVDEQWHDQILRVHVDDEVVISLPENRSSGHRWMLADDAGATVVRPPPQTPTRAITRTTVQALIDSLEAAQPGAPPASVVRRLRSRAAANEPARRPPLGDYDGIELIDDQYVPYRAPGVTRNQARRARLAALERPGQLERLPTARVGGAGRRLLGVRFGIPGVHSVRLTYRSPFIPQGPPLEHFTVHALVETRRTGISVTQLPADDATWVEQVRTRQALAVPPPLDLDESFID